MNFVGNGYDSDGAGVSLGRLANVFGDRTRRGIYRHLRDSGEACSAGEVASHFNIHRTVARAHLEKLSELDLVSIATRRRAGGGRPAKIYSISGSRLEMMLPLRNHERLARMLLQAARETVEAEVMIATAAALGRAFGEQFAEELSGKPPSHGACDGSGPRAARMSPQAVTDWMDLSGYRASLSFDGDGHGVFEIGHCVYGDLSEDYPEVVCAYDRSVFAGMLGIEEFSVSRTRWDGGSDGRCRHEFRL
jgi:predicted ArsR family transcriptional regulator